MLNYGYLVLAELSILITYRATDRQREIAIMPYNDLDHLTAGPSKKINSIDLPVVNIQLINFNASYLLLIANC